MGTLLSILGGLIAGYGVGYVKFAFDAEKSRFDFRIKILREIWEAVVFAKSLAANLDPVGELYADPNETREQKVQRRLEEFGPELLNAKKIVRFNAPFYPVALHDLAKKVLLEAELLARFISSSSPQSVTKYWEKIEKDTSTLNELADQLCNGIREEAARPKVWFLRKAN